MNSLLYFITDHEHKRKEARGGGVKHRRAVNVLSCYTEYIENLSVFIDRGGGPRLFITI